MSVQPQIFSDSDAVMQAAPGTTFARTPIGWDVKWVDGGTVIVVQGPTITEALASHGVQIVHPERRVVIDEHLGPDEDAALEATFEAGTALDVLPGEDRRTTKKGKKS